MSDTVQKRDPSVDLIKIIACIMIVAIHALPLTDAFPGKAEFFVVTKSITAQGVGIFMMAGGFFIFRKQKPLKQYWKFILTRGIPTLLVALLFTWLSPWTTGRASILSALAHPDWNAFLNIPKALVKGIFEGPSALMLESVEHLWFMASYFFCVLVAPLLALVCNDEKKSKLIRRIIIGVLVLLVGLRDLEAVIGVTFFSHAGFSFGRFGIHVNAVLPYIGNVLFMLVGYEIYHNKALIQSRKVAALVSAGVTFIALAVLRYLVLYKMSADGGFFMNYMNLAGLLEAAAVIVLFIAVPKKENKLISYVGGRTFTVYLLHLVFVQKLMTRGAFDQIRRTLFPQTPFLYSVVITLAMFLLTLAVSIVLHEAWKRVKLLFGKGIENYGKKVDK